MANELQAVRQPRFHSHNRETQDFAEYRVYSIYMRQCTVTTSLSQITIHVSNVDVTWHANLAPAYAANQTWKERRLF